MEFWSPSCQMNLKSLKINSLLNYSVWCPHSFFMFFVLTVIYDCGFILFWLLTRKSIWNSKYVRMLCWFALHDISSTEQLSIWSIKQAWCIQFARMRGNLFVQSSDPAHSSAWTAPEESFHLWQAWTRGPTCERCTCFRTVYLLLDLFSHWISFLVDSFYEVSRVNVLVF